MLIHFILAFVINIIFASSSDAVVTAEDNDVKRSIALGKKPLSAVTVRALILRKDFATTPITATAYEGRLITSAHWFKEDDFKMAFGADKSKHYLPFIKKDKSSHGPSQNPIISILYDTTQIYTDDGKAWGATCLDEDIINELKPREAAQLKRETAYALRNLESICISDPRIKGQPGLKGRVAYINFVNPVPQFKGTQITTVNRNEPFPAYVASFNRHGNNSKPEVLEHFKPGTPKHVVQTTVALEDGNYVHRYILRPDHQALHQFTAPEKDALKLTGIPWQGDSGTPLIVQIDGNPYVIGIYECTMMNPETEEGLKIQPPGAFEIIEKIEINDGKKEGAVKANEVTQHYISLFGLMDWINRCREGNGGPDLKAEDGAASALAVVLDEKLVIDGAKAS